MSIRHRIVFLVVLVFLALGLIGGYAVFQSRANSNQVRQVTEGVVPSAIRSAELMTQLKDVHISALAMVAAPDEDAVRKAMEELNARKAGLQAALEEQRQQADSDAQRGLIGEAQESLVNYFASINDTAKFKLAGQHAMAEATMGATVDQYLREQGQMIDAVQVEKRRSKDAAIDALNRELARTTAALSVISLVAILGLGAVGILLYRQVIHPIAEMESKMTEIATSQDFTHRLTIGRQDEIGRSMIAFNAMVEKIEQSTALVKQKAADIHAMLHYIPQGILTVEATGRVHPEYSEFLKTIFETSDLAGRPVMELVFEDSGLGADLLAQTEAAIGACVGEDEMNFAFNAHLLPAEVHRTMADGRTKILDLTWAPITDEAGTTLRLMLCVRDVTALRGLEHAARAQQRELAIIGEILAVQHEKFHAFLEGAAGLLDDNLRILRQGVPDAAAHQSERIGLMFRNMHTVKGNARTYGLLQLGDVLHQAEQAYDAVRSGTVAWSAETLMIDLAAAQQALDEYRRINTTKLGRTGPGRRGDSEKFLLVARHDVRAMLDRLQAVPAGEGDAMAEALHFTRETLLRAGTERLEAMLQPVLDSLPALADELGKEAPRVTVTDAGIAIHSQVSGVLRNVFMHLLRNAMDHGIETPLSRISRGKPAAGAIDITVALADQLSLRLQDDGQGLDLARIRAKAGEKGLIDATRTLSAVDIAQLILAPGFSTAERVTEISGRGVGMDAVRGFVEAEGGQLAVRLLGPEGAAVQRFEIAIDLPARCAVRPVSKVHVLA